MKGSVKILLAGAALAAILGLAFVATRAVWSIDDSLIYPNKVALPEGLPALEHDTSVDKGGDGEAVLVLTHALYLSGHYCGWQRCLTDGSEASEDRLRRWIRNEIHESNGQQSVKAPDRAVFSYLEGFRVGYKECEARLTRRRLRVGVEQTSEEAKNARYPSSRCSGVSTDEGAKDEA